MKAVSGGTSESVLDVYRHSLFLLCSYLWIINSRIELPRFNHLFVHLLSQRLCNISMSHTVPDQRAKTQILIKTFMMQVIGSLITNSVRELPSVFLINHGEVNPPINTHIMENDTVKYLHARARLRYTKRVLSIIEPNEVFLIRQAKSFHHPTWD